MSRKGGIVLSIKNVSDPLIEAKIATEIVVVAHWIQRHEYAIKLPQGLYVAAQNSAITLDKPSTTIEFYLHRIPLRDPKLHVMGDLYLICRAKIGSLIQELDDKIRADAKRDAEKVVHCFGLDGRSRGQRVTIGCLLGVLREKAENLIDFAPFVIGAMNKHHERERAMRVLEGLEDMVLPNLGFMPHQNAEPRVVGHCSTLSPFHIFAHLNEKHRVESIQEEQRRQSQFAKQTVETVITDSDPEASRRAAFATFESVRDKNGGGGGGLSGYRDMSYFSDKSVTSRHEQVLQPPAYKPYDSGYVSGTTIEQLEEYNKLAPEKEDVTEYQRVVELNNAASQPLPSQLGSQMTTSPTMQFQQLTDDVWAGYGCDRHVEGEGDQNSGDKPFDWDALVMRYPVVASSHDGNSDDAFSWERTATQNNQAEFFPAFAQIGNSHSNAEIDNSRLSYEVPQQGCEEQAHVEKRGESEGESDSNPDEEAILRKRAHTMALLEGKDRSANAIAAAWDEGMSRKFLTWIHAPREPEEDLQNAKKGFFSRFRNKTR
ncbi:MAG: hypothetical protein M1839_009178 [Geoglossum umbratile]|nr:MAG: hypothetical protein M1839_009178 [Geoglossum umbratile]